MKPDMRIIVTKRMLREGLLRCLEEKPLSRITISDLCRESASDTRIRRSIRPMNEPLLIYISPL